MTDTRNVAAGHLAALVTILIWGTTFISTKVLLRDFSPLEVLFFRFLIGYLILLVIYPRLIKFRSAKEELLFAAAGLFGVTLYFLLENIALLYTFASNVGILVSVSPFLTAILAHYLLKEEQLRAQFFVGFIVAMIGIMLITLNGSFVLKLDPLGDTLAVLASVCWAAYSILMRKISRLGYHTISCTRRIFFYGLLLMLPAMFVFDLRVGIERFADATNLLNMLFLGLGASALCFVTWNWSVGILGVVQTSIYIYLVPVITVSAAFLILDETITAAAILGTFLTLAGLCLSDERFRKKQKRTKETMAKEAG